MPHKTIAVLGTGDMGHAVGRALGEHGYDVVTCLAERSRRSRKLAAAAGISDVTDLDTLVREADLFLSILPPAAALDCAQSIAGAMTRSGSKPPYADCNAISPASARDVAATISGAGALFIDAGIIGDAPGRGDPTRFYVSGPDTTPMEELDGKGIAIRPIGTEVGRASGIKMCYAALSKGTSTLHTAVLIAAEALELTAELRQELQFSQQKAYARMQANVPWLPADAGRWIGEMEEISDTLEAVGVTPNFHRGAAEIYRLLDATPFAAETRETMDTSRTLEEAIRVYASHLPSKRK